MRIHAHGSRRAEGDLPAEDADRRVDRHDEPHRAAGRFRRRCRDHPGRTGRRDRDDAAWRITGQKIFITWGEHDLTDNIVHLVLARTPGSPPGTKGISMFVVPKFLVDADGSLGERNAVHCVSIEHKLGIHGSPTCVMSYEGAIGWLVGDEHDGHAQHVHDDEQRPPVGRPRRAVHQRARLSAGAGVRPASASRVGRRGRTGRRRRARSSSTPTCAGC